MTMMVKSVIAAVVTVAAVVLAPTAVAAGPGTGHSGKGSTSPDPGSNAAVVKQIADQIKHCHSGIGICQKIYRPRNG